MRLLAKTNALLRNISRYSYLLAREAMVPLVFFSLAFAWFNLSQEISEDFVLMDLYNYPVYFGYWLFVWCPLPLFFLWLFYLDNVKKKGSALPFLLLIQGFVTYSYFRWAINGSSMNRMEAQGLHIFSGPIVVMLWTLPFMYLALKYHRRDNSGRIAGVDAEATGRARTLNTKSILMRMGVWGLLSLAMCLAFAQDPMYFRPMILVARKWFGVE